MMEQTEDPGLALDACYAALFGQVAWPTALERLAVSLNAAGCSFHARDAGPERLTFPASPHYQAFLRDFYSEGWWKDDHRGRRAWPQADAGVSQVFLEHDVASDEERQRLPVYHEVYARYDVPWWSCVAFRVEGRMWAMPFLRGTRQGPFLPEEKPVLTALGPQLARIVSLAHHVAANNARSVLRSVQALDVAAILCDQLGRVTDLNAAAEALLGDGLRVSHGRLAADHPASHADLAGLIQTAGLARSPSDTRSNLSAIIRRTGAPLVVEAVPAAGIIADAFGCYGALLFVRRLDSRRVAPERLMREIFAMTAAEARLAILVGSGLTLKESAARLAITEGTARTLLKVVFDKMGISRQAELVQLAERLARPAPTTH